MLFSQSAPVSRNSSPTNMKQSYTPSNMSSPENQNNLDFLDNKNIDNVSKTISPTIEIVSSVPNYSSPKLFSEQTLSRMFPGQSNDRNVSSTNSNANYGNSGNSANQNNQNNSLNKNSNNNSMNRSTSKIITNKFGDEIEVTFTNQINQNGRWNNYWEDQNNNSVDDRNRNNNSMNNNDNDALFQQRPWGGGNQVLVQGISISGRNSSVVHNNISGRNSSNSAGGGTGRYYDASGVYAEGLPEWQRLQSLEQLPARVSLSQDPDKWSTAHDTQGAGSTAKSDSEEFVDLEAGVNLTPTNRTLVNRTGGTPEKQQEDYYGSMSNGITISVVGEPIEQRPQPQTRPRWNRFQIDTTLEGAIPNHRASTESLKFSGHAAPWPTCSTPVTNPRYELKEFQEKAQNLFLEFVRGADYNEFSTQIQALQCKNFHDSLASLIFRSSLDIRDMSISLEHASAKNCLAKLANDGVISRSALVRGLWKWVVDIEDLQLDVPYAVFEVLNLFESLVTEDIIEDSVLCRIPEQILQMGASEKYSGIIEEMTLFKNLVFLVLRDYFLNANWDRFESAISELNMPNYHHELVKISFTLAFDFSPAERKMVSKMLMGLLKKGIIVEQDIHHGVAVVVGKLAEFSRTDVPYAKQYCVQMLSDCVLDEIVSADLVKKEMMLEYGGQVGTEVFQEVLYRTPEYSRKIWGSTDGAQSLMNEMDTSITEYFDSLDCEEIARIVGELHLSQEFDIIFIKKLLVQAMEKGAISQGLRAVTHLKDNYWSTQDIENAIETLQANENDLALDFPEIRSALQMLVMECVSSNLASEQFLKISRQYIV